MAGRGFGPKWVERKREREGGGGPSCVGIEHGGWQITPPMRTEIKAIHGRQLVGWTLGATPAKPYETSSSSRTAVGRVSFFREVRRFIDSNAASSAGSWRVGLEIKTAGGRIVGSGRMVTGSTAEQTNMGVGFRGGVVEQQETWAWDYRGPPMKETSGRREYSTVKIVGRAIERRNKTHINHGGSPALG